MSIADARFSDLFRFATVRNPQLYDPEALRKRFVQFDIQPAQLLALPDAATLLLTTIPAARAQGNTVASTASTVAAFHRNSARRIASVRDLLSRFPTDFAPVDVWLRVTRHPRLADLVDQFLSAGIVPVMIVGQASFVDDRVTLWENLIAQYFQPVDPELREEVIKRIRWFWVLRRIAATDPELVTEDDVRSATRATVLIPNAMLPPPATVAPPVAPAAPPRERPAAGGARGESIGRKIVQLEQALAEVNTAYRLQDAGLRGTGWGDQSGTAGVKGAGMTPFAGFTDATIASLSPETVSTLRTAGLAPGTDPVAVIRQRLSGEIRESYRIFIADSPASRSLFIGGGVIHLDEVFTPFPNAEPTAKPLRRLPIPTGKGNVSSLGIADLRVVRTEILKYSPGEIAHIENVLVGETKKHTFRTLKRDELADVKEAGTTSEQERDSQTTDRFELSQESAQVIKDDLKFDAGVTLSADFGRIKLGTTASFATSKSKETSNRLAAKQAFEVVSKAVKLIVERRRHQGTTVSMLETDETDLHELANPGTHNLAGIYDWIDKYYLAKVVNCGKRLMLEFLVPEPAAFHVYSKTAKPAAEDAVVRPRPPAIAGINSDPADPCTWVPLTSFDLITPDNVGAAAAPYDAAITPAPAPEVTVGIAIKSPESAAPGGENFPPIPVSAEISSALTVPVGYQAAWATVEAAGGITVVPGQTWFEELTNGKKAPFLDKPLAAIVLVGNNRFDMNALGGQSQSPMDNETGIVPVSVYMAASHWVVNVEVQCVCLDDHIVRWQMMTFAMITAAYEAKLKEYRDWLARQDARARSEHDGSNPLLNRGTEREELKKSAIEILANQHFDSFDAMTLDPVNMYPQLDIARARDEGHYVQFFEQAFEWHNMTYLFYPYFWNQKPNWVFVKHREDADPLFTKFLQAGYARVVVPVRDSYREALLHYLDSPWGEIWNGGEVPCPNDPLYVSIVDEFKEENGDFTSEEIVEAFEVRLPTSLVMLQPVKDGLPDFSKDLNWPPK